RYATAAAISAAHFGPGVPVVFIATGLNFPDALAAGPAAAKLGGPVLLVGPDTLPVPTATELARLGPKRIVVLGSTGAVSDGVFAALGAYAPQVDRVAGPDRYATAVATSQAAFAPGVPVVFVATGLNFPDALAGSAAGARLGGPVLLVPGTTIPDAVAAELKRLTPASIRVLGGPSVVSDGVLQALRAYAPDVARLSGADRYATAAAVTAATYEPGVPGLQLATGLDFPDALAGAPLGGPVLLLPGGAPLPSSVATEAVRLKPGMLEPLGGPFVVPDSAVTSVVTTLAAAP
ncbi:MAG TPA: cell wall-binding repeat-containing protein, partial [Candidatus Dormibacteraeota bacterium]|nr:cell wall-binding repeat-containing protein [Candidatus Dormibacteraeota bacterium]